MHGLPHAIKDLEETAGIRTTSGSPLFADFVPDADSLMVARRISARRRDRDRQDQRARVRPRLAHLQRRLRHHAATPYDRAKTAGGCSGGAAVGARDAACCRWPTAATTWARCATRRRWNNVVRLPAVATAACRSPPPSEVFESRRSAPKGRWAARVARRRRAARHAQAGSDPRAAALDRRGPGGLRRRRSTPPTPRGSRIGWLGDLGGHLPMEPGDPRTLRGGAADALRRRGGPGRPRLRSCARSWQACRDPAPLSTPRWALELPRERIEAGDPRGRPRRARGHRARRCTRPRRDADRASPQRPARCCATLRRAGAAERAGLPVRRRDPLAAARSPGGRWTPTTAGWRWSSTRRWPACPCRRAGRVRARRAADGHAADRPPARRSRAARAHRGLRPCNGWVALRPPRR